MPTEIALPFTPVPDPRLLFATRVVLCALLGGLVVVGMLRREWVTDRLRTWLLVPAPPFNLGVLRFVLFATMLGVALTRRDLLLTTHVGIAPQRMLFGVPKFLVFPVPSMEVATALTVLFRILCALAALGLFARFTCAAATALAFYVFGVCQFYGAVSHMHHLVALGVLLSLSPSGDAFSLDAVLRARCGAPTPEAPRLCYGVPLRLTWLLLACVMFFPGFWKLWKCGVQWASAENLRNILHTEWSMYGWTSPLRVDRVPLLCALGAWGALIVEAGMPLFVLGTPWMRAFGAAGAFGFLCGVVAVMGIPFWHLAVCFAAFVDWDRLRPRRSVAPNEGDLPAPDAVPRRTLVAGVLLLLGFGFFGAIRMASWPFAVYPTFDRLYAPVRARVRVSVCHADGTVQPVDPSIIVSLLNYPRWEYMAERLPSLPTARQDELAGGMTAWIRRCGVTLSPTDEVEFYQEFVWTAPERDGVPPLERRLLLRRAVGP